MGSIHPLPFSPSFSRVIPQQQRVRKRPRNPRRLSHLDNLILLRQILECSYQNVPAVGGEVALSAQTGRVLPNQDLPHLQPQQPSWSTFSPISGKQKAKQTPPLLLKARSVLGHAPQGRCRWRRSSARDSPWCPRPGVDANRTTERPPDAGADLPHADLTSGHAFGSTCRSLDFGGSQTELETNPLNPR